MEPILGAKGMGFLVYLIIRFIVDSTYVNFSQKIFLSNCYLAKYSLNILLVDTKSSFLVSWLP
jgi:hypothetical protein